MPLLSPSVKCAHPHEAASLLDDIHALSPSGDEIEFLCQVNSLWCSPATCFQCWHSVQLDQLVDTSSLARLLRSGEVAARLTPWNQERTLSFFNDVPCTNPRMRTFRDA